MYGNGIYPMGATQPQQAAPAAPAPAPETGWPFSYGADVPLAGGGSSVVTIQITSHDFKPQFLVACNTATGGTPAAFSTRLKIDGRNFENAAIHSSNMWGTAANPFPLLTPLTFKKGTILEFTFTDLSGAANAFSFALNGVELN